MTRRADERDAEFVSLPSSGLFRHLSPHVSATRYRRRVNTASRRIVLGYVTEFVRVEVAQSGGSLKGSKC